MGRLSNADKLRTKIIPTHCVVLTVGFAKPQVLSGFTEDSGIRHLDNREKWASENGRKFTRKTPKLLVLTSGYGENTLEVVAL